MKKFIAEFKEFAMKGNVVDMAIGVVIGAAFGKITTSLVNDVIMPLISRITGGVDFSAWKWVLKAAEVDETGAETAAEIAVNYGSFIAVVLDFLIIALEQSICIILVQIVLLDLSIIMISNPYCKFFHHYFYYKCSYFKNWHCIFPLPFFLFPIRLFSQP